MPDYDLGRAHGEIVIDHDERANKATERALRELRDDIRALDRQIKDLNDTMRRQAAHLHASSRAADHAAASTNRLTAAQRRNAVAARTMTAANVTLGRSLRSTGNLATGAVQSLAEFGASYVGIKNVSFAAKDMGENMVRLGATLKRVSYRLDPYLSAVQNVNIGLKWTAMRSAQASAGLAKFGNSVGIVSRNLRDSAAAFRDSQKAAYAHAETMSNTYRNIRVLGSEIQNEYVNIGARFVKSLGRMTLTVGGLRKALAEMPPAMKAIYSASMAVVTVANALDSIATKVKTVGAALGSLASAGFAKATDAAKAMVASTTAAVASLANVTKGFVAARIAALKYAAGAAQAAAANLLISNTSRRTRLMMAQWAGILTNNAKAATNFVRSTSGFQASARGIRRVATAFTLFGGSVAGAMTRVGGLNVLQNLTVPLKGLARNFIETNAHVQAFRKRLTDAGVSTARFGRTLGGMGAGVTKMASGMLTAVSGAAMLRRALTGFKPLMNKIVFGLQAIVLAAVAVGAAGGLIMGLGNALKQLSGIVGILPGAISAAALALGPLIIGFMGLAKAIGAGTKEGEEFTKAIEGMSPEMKKVAFAVKDVKGEWKELKEITTDTIFKDFDQEIRGITKDVLPSLKVGLKQVSGGLNDFIQQITSHLREPETIHKLNAAFTDTANLTTNLGRAFGPLLDGMREFGTEGLSILARMSRSASNMTSVFAVWAKSMTVKDAETGMSRLDAIVQRSIRGWGQLGSIVKDAFGIVGDFFHAIGRSGTNALDRWSRSIAEARQSLQEMYADGGIKTMTAAFTTLAGHMQQALKIIIDGFRDLGQSIGPELADITQAFSVGFVNGVRKAVEIIGSFIKLVANIPGVDSIIGIAASMVTLFKATQLVFGMFSKLVAILVAPIMLFKGLTSSIVGYIAAVKAGTTGTAFMARALDRLKISAVGAQIALGAIGAALGIALVAFASWAYFSEKSRQKNAEVEASIKKTTEGLHDFRDAVYEANGAIDTKAMDALAVSIEGMYEQLTQKANSDATGIKEFARQVDNISQIVTFGMAGRDDHEKEANRIDDVARAAERGKQKLDSYGMSMADIGKVASGSESDFLAFRQAFVNMGKDGADVVQLLDNARAKVTAVTDAAKAMGPGALNISNGLRKMGEEGASTTDKLEGLKQVLQGLGLIQTSAEQQMFEYQEELKKLGDTSQYVVDQNAKLGKAMTDVNGKLDPRNSNAQELNKVLQGISDKFLANAAAGNDAGQMYKDLLPQIRKVGEAYGFQGDEILEVIKNYGIVPAEVSTIMALVGADSIERDIAGLLLQIDQLTNKPKTISIESQAAVDQLKALGVAVGNFNAETKTAEVSLKPGQNAEQVAASLTAWLSQNVEVDPKLKPGFQQNLKKELSGQPPVEVPVKPGVARQERIPANAGAGGASTPTPTPQAPSNPLQPVEQSANQAKSGVDNLKKAMEGLKDVVVTVKVFGTNEAAVGAERLRAALDAVREKVVNVKVYGTNEAAGPAERLRAALDAIKDVTATVHIEGLVEMNEAMLRTIELLDAVGNSAEKAATKVSEAFKSMKTAADEFKTLVATINAQLVTLANSGFTRGQTLGQGFANGILSKVEAVHEAATELAKAASQPLPNSPAKTGPFSGRGWTPYRGKALAKGFADGIAAGTGSVQSVSLDLARAVASAIDEINVAWSGVDTNFDANRDIPGAKKYYRDPEISKAELEKARRERAEEEAQQAKDDAYRASKKAGEDLPEQESKVKDAEQKVRDAEKELKEAKDNEDIKRAKDRLAEAQVDLKDQQDELKRIKDQAASNPGAAASGAAAAGTKGGLRPNPNRTDYLAAMSDIASRFNLQLTSGMRDEPGSFHSTGQAGDFSNGVRTPEMLAFANFIADNFRPWTKELIYDDPRFDRQIDEGKFVGGGGGSSGFFAGSGDHSNHVHWAVSEAPEWTGAIGKAITDSINQGAADGAHKAKPKVADAVSGGVLTVPLVQNPDGTWSSTDKAWDHLIQRESGGKPKIKQGIVDANTGGNEAEGLFQIARGTWEGNGGKDFAETAGQATAEQQAIIAARIFQKSGGSPWGAGMPGRESEEELRAGLVRSGAAPQSSGTYGSATEDTAAQQLEALRAQNQTLDQTIKTLQNPDSTDEQIIGSLQDLDTTIKNTEDPDIREQLEQIRDNTMTDRGIKEYDPEEGKSEDPIGDTIGIAQNVLGIYNAMSSGFQNAGQLFEMMVRGIENTKDINDMVDGFQSIVSTITGIVDTVVSVAGTVASLAALAGAAVPGVGQALAAVSAVTGGIGQVQSVVDLIQDAFSIVGRWVGSALSWLVGGGQGPLKGDVKALLDTNNQTLKFWSSDNALNKSSFNLDPFNMFQDRETGMTTNQYNIYANPNAPASEIVNELGYAMRVNGTGAYQE
ncbi:tail length tape measure protein [Gordonia phage Gibbin]|uniref:Tape measure protein n=1 Tax=Gordonia phage Gibbin TaxID=2599843 RepID=A0A5J6TL81_9CAUD|nr:tail length tape measure protein [Gordonia phage Gibbin]QFG10569.1 tape measure protein [Gordonia phage Gibbin]